MDIIQYNYCSSATPYGGGGINSRKPLRLYMRNPVVFATTKGSSRVGPKRM